MDPRIKAILLDVDEEGWSTDGLWNPETLATLKKIAEHAEANVIWRAIDTRIDLAVERHRQQLRESRHWDKTGEDPAKGEESITTNFNDEALRVADHSWAYMTDMQFLDVATKTQRLAILRRVESSIRDLQECIKAVSYEHEGVLYWYMDELQRDFAVECAEQAMTEIDSYFAGRIRKMSHIAIAVQAPAVQPAGYLESMLMTFRNWSEEKPLVPSPNAQNAKRLTLIRGLTGYFRERYGTPLRKQVLIITSCFFDTSSLSEADITKLAP